MLSVLDIGAYSQSLGPPSDHYVVFLGKTLFPYTAFLHPGVYYDTRQFLNQC